MKSCAKPSFWKAYAKLDKNVKRRAARVYQLWLNDPSHPGLELKRVGVFYSVRVDGHRVLGFLDGDTMTWVWIGSHDEYMRLIKRK